ncbi:MAG: hypothetical protein KA123_03205 [Candidatus Eisenbacteria bacterium]|nr:hypothetical protein [Candidatus Eisenbacteria bacterium]
MVSITRGEGRRRATHWLALAALAAALAAVPAQAHWDGYQPLAQDRGEPLYAIRIPNLFYHNVGLLQVMVTNVGVIGNPFGGDTYGAGWKEGEYLYAASLWIGAIAPDNLAYVSTGAYETEMLPPIDPRYTMYESYEGIVGGERRGFSATQGDDDGDGKVDEDFHNSFDDDGDGKVDEDYEAISQQMFSCEYWDNTEEARSFYPDHRPLGLHVKQRSFAWSTPGANEFIGLDYVVINEGFEVLRQIFLGYFVDSDAGLKSADAYYTDDGAALAQIDTTFIDRSITYRCSDGDGTPRDCREQQLNIDIAYMFDHPGSDTGGNAADDMPPGSQGYFGGMFLGHTTDPFGEWAPAEVGIYTLAFFSGSGTYPDGDPNNDYQRYDLLQRGTVPTRPTGQPSDYRYCFSAGPFKELLPGEQLTFQVAFVIGNKEEGMIHNSLMAQRIFNGQWQDVDNNLFTGCNGRETCLHIEPGGDPLFWKDPCDSLSQPEGPIKNTECNLPQYWRDADCNCCTPIQDSVNVCKGKETLVHWVGTVAPPPPALNLEDHEASNSPEVVGDRRVRITWDNTSELVADPIRQEILFTGYKVWRVEGWTRPIGSTGPAPSDWQQIAILTHEPVGTELDLDAFTDTTIAALDSVPDPEHEGGKLPHFPVGRYFFVDDQGLKNGMLYFYDVTAYSTFYDNGQLQVLTSQPAAIESDGVVPIWEAASADAWKDEVIVVPNPWNGRAAWDLTPSDADPTGTKIAFAKLPACNCHVRIYTLSGDLVEDLASDGRGTVFWNMISRNGQDITSGVYLYAVQCKARPGEDQPCDGESMVGRFTVIR